MRLDDIKFLVFVCLTIGKLSLVWSVGPGDVLSLRVGFELVTVGNR